MKVRGSVIDYSEFIINVLGSMFKATGHGAQGMEHRA